MILKLSLFLSFFSCILILSPTLRLCLEEKCMKELGESVVELAMTSNILPKKIPVPPAWSGCKTFSRLGEKIW